VGYRSHGESTCSGNEPGEDGAASTIRAETSRKHRPRECALGTHEWQGMDCACSVDMDHETTEDVNTGTNTHTPRKMLKDIRR